MTAYVIRRIWQMIPTLAGVILLIFILFNWVGGDPAHVLAGKISNPEQIENIRKQLGVDQPYWYQLWVFVKQVFTFDFGRSWSTNEEVSRILVTRVGPTLTIMVPVLVIETILAVTFAVMVAYVRGTAIDRGIMTVCTTVKPRPPAEQTSMSAESSNSPMMRGRILCLSNHPSNAARMPIFVVGSSAGAASSERGKLRRSFAASAGTAQNVIPE